MVNIIIIENNQSKRATTVAMQAKKVKQVKAKISDKCNKPLRDACNNIVGRCKNKLAAGDTTCDQCHSMLFQTCTTRCDCSRSGTLYCGKHRG
jgi:hypothetical protein